MDKSEKRIEAGSGKRIEVGLQPLAYIRYGFDRIDRVMRRQILTCLDDQGNGN